MSSDPAEHPEFEVYETEAPDAGVLIGGFSEFGLAGLTAVEYLVDHLEMDQTGHVVAEDLPTITPFESGRPRHPIRLFSKGDSDVTLLVSELFVPVPAARSFSESLFGWIDRTGIEEVSVLTGAPIQHAPGEHRTFYIATDDYRAHRLADADVPAMASGFLDGVNASVLTEGMQTELRAGILVTPAHSQVPDVQAALRLVETVRDLYDLAVDTGPLESFAVEIEQHYRDLAERIERVQREERPEDRMYM